MRIIRLTDLVQPKSNRSSAYRFFSDRTRRTLIAAVLVFGSTGAVADIVPTEPIAPAQRPHPASPQSLSDAYAAALKRSETVDIQRELLYQANENVNQAYGAIAPTISGSATYLHQEIPQTGSTSPTFLADQRTTKLTADQPLFRGFRDFAAVRQRKFLVDAQLFNYKTAAKQLFFDLSVAFYNVLAYQADVQNYQIAIDIYQKRLGELRRFIQIGRSRQTDLLTFQSSMSSLEAQLELTLGQLESAKDVLAYLTGWDRQTALRDAEGQVPATTVEEALARIEDRPDIRAAANNAKASTEGVPVTRGQHYPNLDLIGDYYFDRPGLPSGQADWDVQLVLAVPIFQGGVISSQVRQAQSVATQAELVLSQTRRQAEQEIRTLFNAYTAEQKQLDKLRETFAYAKKNFEAEERDYRNGLVTNLDVLTSINTYQDAQRNLDHTLMQSRADGAKLQAATARRAEIDVAYDKPVEKK